MSITIAQLTDTHLCDHPRTELRGCHPGRQLEAVLDRVAQLKPNYLLLTGDLADTGLPSAYQQLVELIQPLQIPSYWLAGNHDCPSAMAAALEPPLFQAPTAVRLGGWQLVLLDSTLATARFGEGELSGQVLQNLAKILETEAPTLIALHHHPLPFGLDWLDLTQLQNAGEFLAAIARAPHVKAVVFGHIHAAFHQQWGDTHFYGTPSSCLQLDFPQATAEDKQPGFRLLHLHPDGTHQTEIHRLTLSVGE